MSEESKIRTTCPSVIEIESLLTNCDNQNLIDHLSDCEICRKILEKSSGDIIDLNNLHDMEIDRDIPYTDNFNNIISALEIGSVIGNYKLIKVIATGGMGIIYEAVDLKLGRSVAIKTIRSDQDIPQLMRRIAREARLQSSLNHPQIVTLYEFGIESGLPYIVMELIHGTTLKSRIQALGPLSSRHSAELVMNIAKAMFYAHSKGVIHRDLKSSNIMLPDDTILNVQKEFSNSSDQKLKSLNPKISDFGLSISSLSSKDFSSTDSLPGTLAYMAPERFNLKGKMNAESSDIYAIGVILYECLTGRPPFIADNPELTIRMIIDHQPPDPRTLLTGISRDIVTICLKCLRKKPTDRYQSANDLADDLNRFISGVPVHARPIGITKRLLLWSDKNRSLAAATFTSLILLFTMIIMGVQFTMTQKQLRMQSDVNAEIARETALQLKIESDQTRNFMYGSITKFAEIIRDLSAVNSQTDAIKLLERVKLANNQLIHGYLSRSSISENNLKGSKIETLFRDGTNVIYLLNMKETGLQTLNRIYEKALNCKKDDPDHQLLMKYGTLSAHVMAMTYLSSNDPQSAMNILNSAWKSFCLVIKSQAPDFYDLNSRKSLLEELIKLNTNQDIQNRLKKDEIRAVNDEINQLTTMINSLEVENGTH